MRFHLYWHRERDDLSLGVVHLDAPPALGTLISSVPECPADKKAACWSGCWSVTGLVAHPAMPGSATVRASEEGRPLPDGQFAIYNVFVEPTEGPFHP